MRALKTLFLLFATASILLAGTLETKIYTLPKEAKPALKEIYRKIDSAKFKIDAAIYSFTHKKIARKLANAAKRGVKVRVIFDKEANLGNRRSQIGYLSKFRNVRTYLLSGKKRKRGKGYGLMHMKMMIIDNRDIILGSANWTYSAFGLNHEVVAFLRSHQKAKRLEKSFEKMILKAEEY